MSTYIRYPSTSSTGEIPTYASFAVLPVSAADGAAAITLDTDTLYIFNSGSNTWLPVASPSTVSSIGTINSETKSANGAVATGGTLVLQTADVTYPGLMSTGSQSIAGNKTFTGTVAANAITSATTIAATGALSGSNFSGSSSGSNTGDVTLAAVGASPNANGASLSGQVLTLQPASASFPGVVTTGTQTFAGDKTLSGNTTISGNLTLTSTVNSSLTGSNARIPSHTNVSVTFTNASLVSIASANNGGVSGGHTLVLTNATGANITIVNNYGGAAAGEAIYTGSGGDVVIPNNSSFWLQYNSTSSAWLCIAAGLVQVGTIDSQAKSANGLVISSKTFYQQTADGTYPGLVSVAAQTFAGAKTFSTAPILSSLTASQAVVTDGSKNLASLAYASANTASALVQRDGSGNFTAGTITAALTGTASGNTTISGQTNHGVVIASSTNAMGSTGAGTSGHLLTSNGASADPTFQSIQGNTTVLKAPTVQKFTSSSGTYTTPTSPSPIYLKITMVGGGGGGAGGTPQGGSAGGAGGDGGDTTFGTNTAGKGLGGATGAGAVAGGAGGTATLGSITGLAINGGNGQGGTIVQTTTTSSNGGNGGASALGGNGGGGSSQSGNTTAGQTNTGGGGGGGGVSQGASASNGFGGAGGGAGATIMGIITSPASSYSYGVGAAGSAGAKGTGGAGSAFDGAAGGSGVIIVEEFYQ